MRRYIRHLPDKPETKTRLRDLDQKTKAIVFKQISLEKVTLLGAFIAMLLVTLASLSSPYIGKIAIDNFIADNNKKGLLLSVLALIGLALLNWLGSFYRSYLTSLAGNRSISRIREDLYRHILDQSVSFFEKEKTGDIISRLSDDVSALSDLISSGLISLFGDLITLIGVVFIMLKLSPRLAWWLFISVPVVIYILRIFGYKIKSVYKTAREKSAELTSGVEEDISGIKVVQSLNRQDYNAEVFSEKSKAAVKANVKATTSMAFLSPLMALNQAGGLILILLIGGSEVLKGRATIGTMLAFLSYSGQLYGPIAELTNFYTLLQTSLASLERISDYMARKPAVPRPINPVSLIECRGEIEITDLSFSYGELPLFRDFNLKIEAGETVAFVGPTGSGKSTLINLIARLYDPTSGSIKIDGLDLRDIEPSFLRRHIGVVPQNVTLFAGSIKDNIAYAKKDATLNEVKEAAKRAMIHTYIESLPKGYDTEIGEAGKGLSGGQRQLISYARAILLDPSILILDEATSSVDAQTETAIKNALEEVLKNRTCIIIAHRFATLKYASRIALLNQGRLEAWGTKEELMATSLLFQELVARQILA